MLYTSEGLTFGLRPNALGLRSFEFYADRRRSQEKVAFGLQDVQNRGMRIVLQRVSSASVSVQEEVIGQIGMGYLLLVCAMEGDRETDARMLADKVVGLRLWDSEGGKINDRSILETGGEILVVSQFTLAGETKKGRRPDYTAAAKPELAKELVALLVLLLRQSGVRSVQEGRFGAHMQVQLQNDGPVTLLVESR